METTIFSLRPKAVALTVFIVMLATSGAIWMATFSSAQKIESDEVSSVVLAGTISGRVFQDFNGNGSYDTTQTTANNGVGTIADPIDRGVAGVSVTAYNPAGANVTTGGVATTDVNGNYTLSMTDAGTGSYRVEFTNLPTGFRPSARSRDSVGAGTTTNAGSTVQFVTGTTANVNLAVNYPSDYSQKNPDVVASMYAEADQITGGNNGQSVLVSFPYSAGSTDTATGALESAFDAPATNSFDIIANQVGTTFGLAYARQTRRVFAAAYFKRHAGFGPQGPNAIYVMNRTGTGSVTTSFTVPGTATNSHESPANWPRDNGNTGWNAVGKSSLGGIALSEDESVLYVWNLANRTLYALNSTTGAQIASQAAPTSLPLPSGSCAAADVRPFALTVYRNQLYVGFVCSAELTANADTFTDANANGIWDQGDYFIDANLDGIHQASESFYDFNGNGVYDAPETFADGDGNGIYNLGDARGMRAYVYTANNTTLAFSAAPVFQMPLNYRRGLTTHTESAMGTWRPWSAIYRNGSTNTNRTVYAQPMLTDIAFDNGNLILGLRDRVGDQVGNGSLSNPNDASNTSFYQPRTAGDVIRACGTLGSWTLESNGRCGGTGTAPQNVAEGPSGGEFYFGDSYDLAGDFILPAVTVNGKGGNHDDTGNGGVEQLPGAPDVVISNFDPIPNIAGMTHDGGVRWLNNTTGAFTKGYRMYNGAGDDTTVFGKAGGIGGSFALLCDPAPIEIGNRVWRDTNGNGVQDPGEPGVANVGVRLYQGNVPVNYNCSTYADNFPAIAYNGSQGTASWTSTPWTEIADDGVVTTGDVRVVADAGFSNAIRLNRASRGLSRAVNLVGSTSATLAFTYRRQASQGATVEYTTNGSTWTVLQTYAAGTDATYQSVSLTLPLTATGIRFLNGASNANNNFFLVDEVVVTACNNQVVTSANGEYYFTGLSPSTAYQVRLDRAADFNPGGPLSGLHLTTRDVTTQLGDDDSSDSDPMNVANPTGSAAGTWPVISLTTGTAGANNHTYDFGYLLAPSAADVSIQGRITTANGNGIRNVMVILTEENGATRYAVTGAFGYYQFTGLQSGQGVVLSLSSKRYTFDQPSKFLALEDDVVDFDWVSNE